MKYITNYNQARLAEIFFLCLFISTVSQVRAQTEKGGLSLEMSPVFTTNEKSIPLDAVGSDSSGYYMLYGGGRYGWKDKFIRKFDMGLKPMGDKLYLEPHINSENTDIVKILVFDSALHQIVSLKISDSTNYYLQKINLRDLSLEKAEYITTLENKGALGVFSFSRDTTILFYLSPAKRSDHVKIRVLTFNADLDEVGREEYEFPYSANEFGISHLILDRNGDFILLASLNVAEYQPDGKSIQYQNYLLYKLSDGILIKFAGILSGGNYMNYNMIAASGNSEIIFAGFYSEKNLFAIKGTFYYRINSESGEILVQKMQPFSGEFFAKLLAENKRKTVLKKAREGNYEDKYYVLTNHFLEDDELTLVAEQRHIIQSNYGTTYFFENIAMVRLDSTGSIIWATKIGKNNSENFNIFSGALFGSFIILKRHDHFFLIYNDNILNATHKTGPVAPAFILCPENYQAVTCCHIFPDGEYERTVISNYNLLEGIRIRPELSNRLDENTLILFGQNPWNIKNQRFVKVNFPPANPSTVP